VPTFHERRYLIMDFSDDVCPECESLLRVEKPKKDDIIECPECGTPLKIIRPYPLIVELAPKSHASTGE
jgi:lysine biosynthesis protein LysW